MKRSLQSRTNEQREQFESILHVLTGKFENYRPKKIIYKGPSSIVFHLKLIGAQQPSKDPSEEDLAVKVLLMKGRKEDKQNRKPQKMQKKINNEISLQKKLSSEWVIPILDSFYGESHWFVSMEYAAKGDLMAIIKGHLASNTKIPLEEFKQTALSIAKSIQHLHQKGVVHRDIKPQNLLLTHGNKIKICDFGCAKVINPGQKITGVKGTLNYIAPEITNFYDQKVDVWSYGCMLICMLTGKTPFAIKTIEEIDKNITCQSIDSTIKEVQKLTTDPHLVQLLRQIFQIDPQNRISISDIVSHKFFTNATTEISQSSQEQNSPTQHTLSRTKSFRRLESPQSLEKKKQNISFYGTQGNQLNFFSTRLSKLMSFTSSQKSSNTSLSSLRSQRYQKIAARRQNLSREMQKTQAFLLEQNRPLIRKIEVSPIKFARLKQVEMETVYGKVKISGKELTKEGNASSTSLYKSAEFRINSDGDKITVIKGGQKNRYSLGTLPYKFHSLYQYCKDIVNIIKNNTVRLKIEVPDGFKLQLMENGRVQIEVGQKKYQSLEELPAALIEKETIVRAYEAVKNILD